jgi:hypothetical protein
VKRKKARKRSTAKASEVNPALTIQRLEILSERRCFVLNAFANSPINGHWQRLHTKAVEKLFNPHDGHFEEDNA